MSPLEAFLSMTIRASSTISQCLAEAFKANCKAQSPPIPEYLTEFTSVFSKKLFNILPEPKQWDHAVEIIPGSKASNCKVYPLSLPEQIELNAFLKEDLETGRIWPSKSPMASPVLRRMAHFDLCRITEHWMWSQWRTSTPFPSSLNSSTNFKGLSTSLNSMSAGDLTMSAWKKETSGKLLFGQTVDFMNPWSCSSD